MFARKETVAVVLLLCGLAGVARGADPIRTVALTGQQAPGTLSGVNFNILNRGPVINSAGQAVFLAGLAGPGVTSGNGGGIWTDAPGNLSLVARSGSIAPGTGPQNVSSFTNFGTVVLNDVGKIAFVGDLGNGGKGIWSDRTGTLALVARNNDPADGMPIGETYREFSAPALNNGGKIAFGALLNSATPGGNYTQGIWTDAAGSLAPRARFGDQAAGTPNGVAYDHFLSLLSPIFNGSGQSAFWGVLTGSGIDSSNSEGVWSEGSGTMALVARSGDQAPGTSAGVNFAGFGTPLLNNVGQTSFRGTLTGSGVDTTNDEGIWRTLGGSAQLIARKGDHAPGAPSGVNFGNTVFSFSPTFFGPPEVNSAGQIAFYAYLTGNGVDITNFQGVWVGDAASPLLVARAGNQAPGTPSGINFKNLGVPVLNDADQAVYLADLVGNGVDTTNDLGIWVAINGTSRLLARKGDALEVLPGDFRTIEDLNFAGGEPGLPGGFNNAGQLVFWAKFTNGSEGIFVATVIPEPSTVALVIVAGLAICIGRRRR